MMKLALKLSRKKVIDLLKNTLKKHSFFAYQILNSRPNEAKVVNGKSWTDLQFRDP